MNRLLAAKLALEAEVGSAVELAASSYIADWVAGDGAVSIKARLHHHHSFDALLVRHYTRVCAVMLGKTPDDSGDLLSVAVNRRHAERLAVRAQQQSLLIVAGIDRELAKASAAIDAGKSFCGRTEVKDDFGSFTIRMVAKVVETAKRAAAAIKKKIPAIANVQTQTVAEEATYEWVEDAKADSTIIKVWSTMLDERVRHAHQEAEGQERRIDQPYDVGGERLRFPGDTGLGASLWNVINCRCTTHYVAVDANGNRHDMGIPLPRVPTRRSSKPGDRWGQEKPISPTEFVTLNGKTRAQVVLGNGKTIATMRQTTPSTIEVLVNRRPVARATHKNGKVTDLVIGPEYQSLGIDKLIKRSVEHSFQRAR